MIRPTIAMSLTSADAVETIEVALSLRVMIQRKSVVCKRKEVGEFKCLHATYIFDGQRGVQRAQPAACGKPPARALRLILSHLRLQSLSSPKNRTIAV